jgi:hypothetical protein
VVLSIELLLSSALFCRNYLPKLAFSFSEKLPKNNFFEMRIEFVSFSLFFRKRKTATKKKKTIISLSLSLFLSFMGPFQIKLRSRLLYSVSVQSVLKHFPSFCFCLIISFPASPLLFSQLCVRVCSLSFFLLPQIWCGLKRTIGAIGRGPSHAVRTIGTMHGIAIACCRNGGWRNFALRKRK